MPMLSEIDFASFNSYHEILSHGIDLTEAEKQLTDERKRFLRTAAKEKAGQASGAGALSSVARGIYNRMVKQAAVKKLWKEKREGAEVENDDNNPLTDVEYEELQSQAGTSQKTQQQSASKGTAVTPPPKKRKQLEDEEKQDDYSLQEILESFHLPDGKLVFSFEELCKATSMSKTNVKLTDWMLVMCKLAETQMLLAMSSADEQQEHIEKLEKQVDKLKLKNTQLSSTIEQQKSVITGIQGLLQHSGTTPAK